MVDAVVAAAGLVKPCGITSIQIQFFKCFPKHAIRSSIIKSDSDCTAFTFCMYSIFIYVPFSKFLGTDILVTPICVLEQDNPDVQHPFLAYLHLPTLKYLHCYIPGICQLHMEEAFVLHIRHILPSLRAAPPSYVLVFIFVILSFTTFTSSLHKRLLYIGVMPIRIPLSSPQY